MRCLAAALAMACGSPAPVCDAPYLLDCPAAVEPMSGCCSEDACWYQTDTVAVLCDGDDCTEAADLMVRLICGPPNRP